ncbi:MAG: hypothetical protein FWD72_04705 [Eggerthellaceae bacterium]|nr:hypothetical protein [Eggerthellaceae bacterium]
MKQGLEGFLTQYCQTLTNLNAKSLKHFFAHTVTDSPRAAEPLLLLALCQGRADYLMRLAAGTKYETEYKSFLSSLADSNQSLESFLSSESAAAPYRKVYNSFLSETGKLSRDRAVLGQLIPQLNSLISEQRVSRYRITKDLGINKGNLYSFLKGDTSKLSRETGMGVYQYLLDQQEGARTS